MLSGTPSDAARFEALTLRDLLKEGESPEALLSLPLKDVLERTRNPVHRDESVAPPAASAAQKATVHGMRHAVHMLASRWQACTPRGHPT